ncbi:MAG: hypothetical protein ACK4K7_14810 [Allosphingosinicella sp.]|uniref:hypothetical protein n=1 Tax=Allosphingosinicella sp. TaxID=2823234 RepID=UPI003943A709
MRRSRSCAKARPPSRLRRRRTESDARLFLFPERRKEWLFTARSGATFRQLRVNGFAPTVRLTYERNAPTVGIYDYKRFATVRAV